MVFEHRRGRDRLYIVAEILEIAREGTLKTQIMYRANLSFTQLNDYLRYMLGINLLYKICENEKERYQTTDKGMHFLQCYRELMELLKLDLEGGISIETKGKGQTQKVKDGLA
jgi:predicted transcriptional regulator